MPLTSTQARAAANPAAARPDPCADPAPPCPVCGGLKCLCRPRFFPGQLLGDEDLNRLQQYVIDKNRLHNRYLVGWGVACGLEVACSPCDAGAVTVRAGYALSPCGDDIVLCADQSVDVCQLIQACRPAKPVLCDPPYSTPPSTCTQGVERWVLAVCYDERPARGTTALTGAGDSLARPGCRCGGSSSSCGCGGAAAASAGGCGCGGSGSGGCGCAAKTSAYQPAGQRRKLLPQCEPTQVCEGFRFTAYRAPAPATGLTSFAADPAAGKINAGGDLMIAWLYANRARFGPLLERTLCCVMRAMDLRASLAEGRQLGTAGVAAYRDYAQALLEFASEFSLHHCSFLGTVRSQYDAVLKWSGTRLSGVLDAADQATLADGFRQLDATWLQIVTECFCSALLPACPPPSTSNCVPLAVVTISTGGTAAKGQRCQVVDICNWQERKLLVTWPTIQYWLSWLPWQRLREFFARICCGGSERQSAAYTLMMTMFGVAVAGARSPGKTNSPVATDKFTEAMAAPNLLQRMFADYEQARVGDASLPAWSALAARMVDGTAFGPLAGDEALRQVDLSDIDKRLGVDAMREQLEQLQATVARQDRILSALQIVRGQGDGTAAMG